MTGPFSARSAAPNRTCPTAGCAGPSSARAARPATGPRTARRSAFNTTATRRPTAGKSARPAPDCRPASCLTGSTRTGHRGGNRRTFRPFRPEGIRICLDCKGIDTPRCRTCHDRGGWLMAWLDGDRRTGPIMLYPAKEIVTCEGWFGVWCHNGRSVANPNSLTGVFQDPSSRNLFPRPANRPRGLAAPATPW